MSQLQIRKNRIPIEINTSTRYTATCQHCSFKISAEYPAGSGKTAVSVSDDFVALGWEHCKETEGLWICNECSGVKGEQKK
ncbi:MAG: hypothetical protein FWG88_05130 [Oscillospiraceae bacterium]|nr:hypothetical protein [Oscillospiraceae bacterium]